jgi:hypothetical protein
VKHFASSKFWALYHELPEEVRALADKNYEFLKSNPRHPALHFKRIGELWSCGLATITEPWELTRQVASTGFGLVRIPSTISSSAKRCEKGCCDNGSKSTIAPNPPRHRIAATLRFGMNLKGLVWATAGERKR